MASPRRSWIPRRGLARSAEQHRDDRDENRRRQRREQNAVACERQTHVVPRRVVVDVLSKPPASEVAQMILRHARMMLEFKGEYIGIREIRKHAAWYTAGYPHGARLRVAINQVENYEQLEALLMEYFV